MKLSVALATYNGAAFISEQLASLAGQTRLPDELVVSDDGSNDATIEIVKAFARTAPFPVHVVEKSDRLGFSDNFLFAAEHCRHDLIAFCDQDDVWLPRKLELGAGRIENEASLLSMHTLIVTDAALRPTGFEWDQGIDRDAVHEALALDPYATGWGNTMVFRKELLKIIPRERRPCQPNNPALPLSHDTWVYMLSAALGRTSWLKQPLLLYRQHGAAATVAARPLSRRQQVLNKARVVVQDFHAHSRIDAAMAQLFDEVAGRPGPFQAAARAAGERFRERCSYWKARAAIFDDNTFSSRATAYMTFHRQHALRHHWWGAHLKDIFLGVSGVSRSGRTSHACTDEHSSCA